MTCAYTNETALYAAGSGRIYHDGFQAGLLHLSSCLSQQIKGGRQGRNEKAKSVQLCQSEKLRKIRVLRTTSLIIKIFR